MSGADVTIRAACLEDAPAIARLHVAVWREAYRDLAPPGAMQALDLSKRQARWVEMLGTAERSVLVAECHGRIVGIGTAVPRQPPSSAITARSSISMWTPRMRVPALDAA